MSGLRIIEALLGLSCVVILVESDHQGVRDGDRKLTTTNDHRESSTSGPGLLIAAPPVSAKPGAREKISGDTPEKEGVTTRENAKEDIKAKKNHDYVIEHVHPKVAAHLNSSGKLGNTITVPDNCPEGQKLVNNLCRDLV